MYARWHVVPASRGLNCMYYVVTSRQKLFHLYISLYTFYKYNENKIMKMYYYYYYLYERKKEKYYYYYY